MKFWLAKTSGVTLREQLTAQVILGITSKDLAPGQRLPSTRELARRYDIHANTVSAAYRELSRRGWVDLRPGSGIFVRTEPPINDGTEAPTLDQLLGAFLGHARQLGFSRAEIRSAFEENWNKPAPNRFLVIEPDPGLREILVAEIAAAIRCLAVGAHPTRVGRKSLTGAIPVILTHEANAVRKLLPPFTDLHQLRISSVPAAMLAAKRPDRDAIIAVVSKWPAFLRWSRTLLAAAGIDPAAIITRDARRPNWDRGLRSADLLISDVVSARLIQRDVRLTTFSIIAADSMNELRERALGFPDATGRKHN
jgi:DNA-binding transcriptional regulator YhcF (GntR family)